MVTTAAASFESLGWLSPCLLDVLLNQWHFHQGMTPVQQATLPVFFTGHKDVIVEAVTGSGKTLAYSLPVLQRLILKCIQEPPPKTQALSVHSIMIAPTRELARQIHQVVQDLIRADDKAGMSEYIQSERKKASLEPLDIHIHPLLLTGGQTTLAQDVAMIKSLLRPNALNLGILIATPGRLNDILALHSHRSGLLNVKEEHFNMMILDEADRLLDMGFEQVLTCIVAKLPKQRRTGLFSATMSDALNNMILKAGMRNPVRIVVKVTSKSQVEKQDHQRIPTSLSIKYLVCEYDEKLSQLLHVLLDRSTSKIMVYFATCACVDYYYKIVKSLLSKHNQEATLFSLHGKMDPKRREAVYASFVSHPQAILLCTDIAARGLDIPDVEFVVQFDAPQDPTCFTHRCGRTARSGRQGEALILLTPKEDTFIEFMQVRKVPMQPTLKYETKWSHQQVLEDIKTLNKQDRDVFEKSTKAFVSWIRSYKEHQANYIFRFQEVDIASVARAFGLLKLPRMPELKMRQIDFTQDPINTDTIAYKDKIREKQRQKQLAKKPSLPPRQELPKKKPKIAWSEQLAIKEKKQIRREKRSLRKTAILKARQEGTFYDSKLVNNKRKLEQEEEEEKEDDNDECLSMSSDTDDEEDYRQWKKEKKTKTMNKSDLIEMIKNRKQLAEA